MPKGHKIDWSQFTADTDDCILWPYATRGGYGIAKAPDGRSTNAHVAAWEFLVEPVKSGWQVDHLCRVTLCCNVRHLEPVTAGENVRRA